MAVITVGKLRFGFEDAVDILPGVDALLARCSARAEAGAA